MSEVLTFDETGAEEILVDSPAMSASEWQVMRVVWAQPGATSRVMIDSLAQDFDWQPVTVKTLLGRLKRKGYLEMKKVGTKYRYYPRIEEVAQVQAEWHKLLSNICNTKQGQLVLDLLAAGQFSQADLQAIIKQAQTQLLTAPERLVCDCRVAQCTCGHQG